MRQESKAGPGNKGDIDPAAIEAEITNLFSPLISTAISDTEWVKTLQVLNAIIRTALGGKPPGPARDKALAGDRRIPVKNIWRY
jgi:hypothetical protein